MKDSDYEAQVDELDELRKQILLEEPKEEEVVVEEVESESEDTVPPVETKEEVVEEEQVQDVEEKKEELILGKFKSQEAVNKAYKDLESKLGAIANEKKRLQDERDEAYRKNLEWQEWSKSQNQPENGFEDEDDQSDPVLRELNRVASKVESIEARDIANAKYTNAINTMAFKYRQCMEDTENFPYFTELKDEMTGLAKELENDFPELAYNPNAIPQIYKICEARKLKADYEATTSKLTTIEQENLKLQNELKRYRKISPSEEDESFVEGGSTSDGDMDLDSLPLEEQVKALAAKIGKARK